MEEGKRVGWLKKKKTKRNANNLYNVFSISYYSIVNADSFCTPPCQLLMFILGIWTTNFYFFLFQKLYPRCQIIYTSMLSLCHSLEGINKSSTLVKEIFVI